MLDASLAAHGLGVTMVSGQDALANLPPRQGRTMSESTYPAPTRHTAHAGVGVSL